MKHLERMTEREKYRTLGTYYLDIVRNYDKAIENFEQLVEPLPCRRQRPRQPGMGLYAHRRRATALAGVRKSLEIYPKNSLQRYNYAMYSMYAGDFATAISEAQRVQKENPKLEHAHLPAALSRLAKGDAAAAAESYRQLSSMSPLGASFARHGPGRHGDVFRPATVPRSTLLRRASTRTSRRRMRRRPRRSQLRWPRRIRPLDSRRAPPPRRSTQRSLSQLESTLFPAARVLVAAWPRRAGAADRCGSRKGAPASYHRLCGDHPRCGRPAAGPLVGGHRGAPRRQAAARFLAGQAPSRRRPMSRRITLRRG